MTKSSQTKAFFQSNYALKNEAEWDKK